MLVSALAWGSSIASTRAEVWPELSGQAAAAADGAADAALIVGIERYVSVSPVPGATANADAWYGYLVRSRKVPPGSVTLLRDGEGSLEKIRKYAGEAASKVRPGGTLWFVFVGHGAPSADGRDGLLVGFDAQQDVDSLYARSVPQKEVLGLLGRGKQAHTVAVVDACFSGRTASGASLAPGLQPLLAVNAGSVGLSKVTLLSAGRNDQFAGPLPGLGRPAFSYLVLGGLHGWADRDQDGKVTAAESVEYAREVLSTTVKDRAQTPELSSGDGHLVLAQGGREKGPDLSVLVLERPQASHVQAESMLAPMPALAGALKEGGAFGLHVNVDALVAYDKALRADNAGYQDPKGAAQAWERLANIEGSNPYRTEALRRAAQWSAVTQNEAAVRMRRQEDEQALRKILTLQSLPQAEKDRLVIEFTQTYGSDSASRLVREVSVMHGMARITGGAYRLWERGDAVVIKPFLLDYHEVTVDAYTDCVRDGKCTDQGLLCDSSANYGKEARGRHPINCVDWQQASVYCRAQGLRLPTEEEWEWAAHQGTVGTRYPWGNDAPHDQICWNRNGSSERGHGTCPVGSLRTGDSRDGVQDLAGNVWEWTSSFSANGQPFRVVRGGSWYSDDPKEVRADNRFWLDPSYRGDHVGFRCAGGIERDAVLDQEGSVAPAVVRLHPDRSEVMEAMNQVKPGVTACGRGRPAGVVSVDFIVDGITGKVNASASSTEETDFAACLTEALETLSFRPFSQRQFRFKYPFVLGSRH